MATRISKNGNTYNVPTQKAVYLPKEGKAYLLALLRPQLETARTTAAKSMTTEDLRAVGIIADLIDKLEASNKHS